MRRLSFLAVLVVALSAASARAQAPATPPATNPPATPAKTKIAVIYSARFQDAKAGIAKFAATINKLNAEFQPTQNELNQTAQRLRTMQDEIAKMQQGATPAPPAQIQIKLNQLDDQKKQYQRRGEDAQAAYQRRRLELLEPLQDEVEKALDAFAKANGITMVLDGSQIPLVYAADAIDITDAFIADYNRRNPATAAATPPK